MLECGTDGMPGFKGIIIARKDSGITTMEQAKGHTFAFTDPNSTSASWCPTCSLRAT